MPRYVLEPWECLSPFEGLESLCDSSWPAGNWASLEARQALSGEPEAPVLDRVPADTHLLGDGVIGLSAGGAEDDLGPNPQPSAGGMVAEFSKSLPLLRSKFDGN